MRNFKKCCFFFLKKVTTKKRVRERGVYSTPTLEVFASCQVYLCVITNSSHVCSVHVEEVKNTNGKHLGY